MSWKGILGKAGVSLTGLNGANDWTFEGAVHARNIISRFAGQHFHVDSGHSAASDSAKYGKRKEKPFATIEYAVSQCTANDGDVIWAHAGHTEAIIAAGGLDLDVEGITIVFLGNGDDQAKITFGTDVDADMDVDADNITLINPRFETAVDALTGPIDVNKANFTVINGEYHDAAGKAAIDCIVAVAAAKGLTLEGWRYVVSTTGTQKQSNIQMNGVDNAVLKNIDVRGDFATGNIENVDDEVLNIRLEDIYLDNLNATPKPGMVLDSDSDGYAKNVSIRVASGTTFVSSTADLNWGPDCLGFNADGEGGDPIGSAPSGSLEGKVDTIDSNVDSILVDTAVIGALGAGLSDLGGMSTAMKGEVQDECEDALEGEDLDHLMKLDSADQAYPVNAANDSVIAKILCKGDPATINTYDCQTDSQEMLSDKLGAYSGDGGALIDDSVKAALDLIEAQTDDIGAAGASLTDLGGMATAMKAEVKAECVDAVVAIPKCIEKSDGAVLNGLDPLFTITGGPVRAKIVGHVTTIIGGASNLRLQHITTDPAATVELNANAVAADNDAVGTVYHNLGATSVFTPSAGLGFVLLDPVTKEETEFILAPGVVQCLGSAAQSGVIKWYMSFEPLSPNSVVVAAA